MTPDPLPPFDAPDHPSLWTIRYLDGTLSEAERASFEAHMKAHAECREHVETMRAALPAVVRVLMERAPPQSAKDFLAGAEARRKSRPSDPMLRPSASARQPAEPASSGSLGASGVSAPEQRVRKWRGPIWAWGAGFAALASAAASLLLILQPFSGAEPELLMTIANAGTVYAPGGDEPERPLPPMPVKLEASAAIRLGKLELRMARDPADAFTAVTLIDVAGQAWEAQAGYVRDPSCAPGCGPLELRVKLDRLVPGPIQVVVLVAPDPIGRPGLEKWLPHAAEVAPQWLGVRGYALTKVKR